MSTPSIEQLRKAIAISEQIEKLEAELKALLGGNGSVMASVRASVEKPGKKKRVMSPEGRARIVAAQKARWALLKGDSSADAEEKSPKGKKAKRSLSPEARAKIAAAAKRRWAKEKGK